MIKIDGNKIITSKKILTFDDEILEAVEYNGYLIIVFNTVKDDKFDNVYCYDKNAVKLWRIQTIPIKICGTARTSYVGIDINNDKCRVIDFYGRRFIIDVSSGKILSKDIVK